MLVFDIPPKGTNITVSEVLEQHCDAITDIAEELGQAPVCLGSAPAVGPGEPVGASGGSLVWFKTLVWSKTLPSYTMVFQGCSLYCPGSWEQPPRQLSGCPSFHRRSAGLCLLCMLGLTLLS